MPQCQAFLKGVTLNKQEDLAHHGSDSKESASKAGDKGSIPGSGRSPGEWSGYPLQYSCLENPMDREEPGRLQSMRLQRVGQD